MVNAEPNFSAIQFSAMTFLSMREHSREELRKKLQKKFESSVLIEAVLNDLRDKNLQSDERFTEAFVKMRIRQGRGPVRIAYELREKGISGDLLVSSVDPADNMWADLAKEVCTRRFGNVFPQNEKEKAKGMRFLLHRGFSSTHIRNILHKE